MMPQVPEKGQRFDEYEPQKFACISVDDEAIEKIMPQLNEVELFHHTVDEPKKGLAYYGITLISPRAEREILDLIKGSDDLANLEALTETALMFDKWIIHFGI